MEETTRIPNSVQSRDKFSMKSFKLSDFLRKIKDIYVELMAFNTAPS